MKRHQKRTRRGPWRSRPGSPPLIILLVSSLTLPVPGCDDGGERAASEGSNQSRVNPTTGEIFSDRTKEAGLDFVHFNGMSGGFYTAEVTGSGCGMLDYDNDGDLDLYLVQGRMLGPGKTQADALFPQQHPLPLMDRLYRNDLEVQPDGTRVLRFTDVTEESGIRSERYGMGVAAGDYNNDGWLDIYVTNLEGNQLFRNNGDATFTDVTREAGVDDERWSVPASFVDYDRDGWLDLFVGNYVEFSFDDPKTCFRVTGALDYCGPLAYTEARDRLLHNEGDGTFENVTRAAGLNAAFGSALGVVAADFDNDQWLDIYVANDGRPNQLWINQRDGTFVDESLLRGAAVNAEGMAEASMGVEAGDFDGDGDEDLFMAHLLGETNTMFANDGQGMYEDVSIASGLSAPSTWATAFGALAIDYDNDGWLDIMTVNGEVRVIEEQVRKNVPFPLRQPNQLFHNLGDGRFEEVSDRAGESFQLLEVSRGAAGGDVDNDGDMDVLVLNNNDPARLLINNVGQDRHWLGLRMVGRSVKRDMLGTRVGLFRGDGPTLWRRVRTDGSFSSVNDSRVLFGLGSSTGIEKIRAYWPSGRVEEWTGIPIDQYTTLTEGSGVEVKQP